MMSKEEVVENAAMILNVPNIHEEGIGITAEVSVFNLKAVLQEAYEEGLEAGASAIL